MNFAQWRRLWQIQRVVRRYGLGEFLGRRPTRHDRPRGERLRLALEALGPVFIKFGQALSTRPDILPPDVAVELAKLQDQVPPFPGAQAQSIIEQALGRPVEELFSSFDPVPLASASVAQVHAARLKPQAPNDPGLDVVVKVIRPGIDKLIRDDIDLLHTLAALAERWHPLGPRLRPREVIAEYEKVIFNELDLMREGASCSQLRRNWLGSKLIYHPLVLWDYTRPEVLVMERIYGVSIRELDRLRQLGVDFRVLSERGVEIFFKQVFRDNFFHADMHPGNIFVDVSDPRQPSYLAVDFGIVGSLTPSDQRYLAENFVAFFNRDYRRVAELHLESEWVPSTTRVEEFEAAIRTVCEPIFHRPLKDISFGFFLLRLFQIARQFNMQVQPQLVLLQKTLLQIEGLGRQLYPDLDLWKTAKPIMDEWMRNRLGPSAMIERARSQFPALAESLPELVYRSLKRIERGDTEAGKLTPAALEALRLEMQSANRRATRIQTGVVFLLAAAVLYGLGAERPVMAFGAPALSWILAAVGGALWWSGRR